MPKAPGQENLSVANILVEPGAVNGLYLMGGENNGSCQHHKAMSDSSFNGIVATSTLTSHDVSRILKQKTESTTKLVLYHKCALVSSFLLNGKKGGRGVYWLKTQVALRFFLDTQILASGGFPTSDSNVHLLSYFLVERSETTSV